MHPPLKTVGWGLKVLGWESTPGRQLPMPKLADDKDSFPPQIVKQVTEWLESRHPAFVNKPPTPQILYLGSDVVGHPVRFKTKREPERVQEIKFEVGTAEVLLKDKRTGMILAAYHYLTARNIYDGRVILGPFLRDEQRMRLETITPGPPV